VVRQAASRLALRYFGSRTLEAVMGAQRESLQETLRSEIARDVAAAKGGIEIVGVVIEEIHPPAGAAAAYHAVQAAGINAEASISTEIGKAAATSGTAQSEAIQLLGSAQASAVETVETANGDAYRFVADKRGYDLSPRSFLMEHSYRNLASALVQTPLTIIDHRLKAGSGTVIDMRASRAGQSSKPDSSAADPAISDQSQNQP
jgi:regulator of protease activity HflC (stomatin/prohibitin superfamily)